MRQGDTRQEIPALYWIIITVAVSYLLQNILGGWFVNLLCLSGEQLQRGFVWTLLSYSLLHAGFFHIFFNMLMLWMWGRDVQKSISGHKFVVLYLICVLAGAVLWLMFNFSPGRNGETAPIVFGASAGVAGVFTVYCLRHWSERITLYLYFVLPVSLTGKHMLMIFAGIDVAGFLCEEVGHMNLFARGVAYSAHVGGMIGGWFFHKYLSSREPLFSKGGASVELPDWIKKKAPSAQDIRNFTINITSRKQLREEVDRILDKINSEGFGSLSDEEKRTLDRAKDILSK